VAVHVELRQFSTPSISNAIETFSIRPRSQGYMDASIGCMFPGLHSRMVGYAVTATIRAAEPGERVPAESLWRHVLTVPAPRVVVVQDLDDPAGRGSFWGEVNANAHRALGCIGTVTNGSVRDLDELEALEFHAFAGSVGVSHAYVRTVGVGEPVIVGGVTVTPGDLLHGDRHGVVSIPHAIADELAERTRQLEDAEREMIEACQAPQFSIENLVHVRARLQQRLDGLAEVGPTGSTTSGEPGASTGR
jgi:4-hydroxy-4-methyl-2-oxoglutarate aldolase